MRATSSLVQFRVSLASWRPHLVLADIQMPTLKGTDLCRVIKQAYATQDLPVVLYSGLEDEDLKKMAEQVGADGYLSKRHGLEQLAAKVNELFESIVW